MSDDRLTPSEKYRLREFSRVRDEVRFWREKFMQANVELARMRAEKELDQFRDRTDVAWLQGKVVAQSRELKRLNDAFNSRRVMAGEEPTPDVDAHTLTKVEVESKQVNRD
jgi:hypothetical protein